MKRTVNLYLDTVLWNILCDRAIDPHNLVASLAARNVKLVLGLHNFYELAKTFGGRRKDALERGQYLFSYLKKFVEADILCIKENDELLAAEMWALKLRTRRVDAFYGKEDFLLLREGVEKLARGGFDERTARYINEQRALASDIRLGQKKRLENRVDVKRFLKSVSPETLEQWLQAEVCSDSGNEFLKDQILRRFPQATETEAMEYASELLASPECRMARGLVRAGSYYLWRCAYCDSVPDDLFDDMSHVLNSVHCDVYATGEKRQKDYASLLLTASTTVAIHNEDTPIDLWLQSLA